MVDIGLLTAFSEIAILLLIGFLVFFVLGFFVKTMKKVLWIIAVLLLIAGIYFVFV